MEKKDAFNQTEFGFHNNNIENTITNIIHEYMNDMNELAEQRSIQLAIQASLDEQ